MAIRIGVGLIQYTLSSYPIILPISGINSTMHVLVLLELNSWILSVPAAARSVFCLCWIHINALFLLYRNVPYSLVIKYKQRLAVKQPRQCELAPCFLSPMDRVINYLHQPVLHMRVFLPDQRCSWRDLPLLYFVLYILASGYCSLATPYLHVSLHPHSCHELLGRTTSTRTSLQAGTSIESI